MCVPQAKLTSLNLLISEEIWRLVGPVEADNARTRTFRMPTLVARLPALE